MKPNPSKYYWRKIDSTHWWCADVGSVTKNAEGWWASYSAYGHIILQPAIGPFKTAKLAMRAWEAWREERHKTVHEIVEKPVQLGPSPRGLGTVDGKTLSDRAEEWKRRRDELQKSSKGPRFLR